MNPGTDARVDDTQERFQEWVTEARLTREGPDGESRNLCERVAINVRLEGDVGGAAGIIDYSLSVDDRPLPLMSAPL
jgi:hypothetical protein